MGGLSPDRIFNLVFDATSNTLRTTPQPPSASVVSIITNGEPVSDTNPLVVRTVPATASVTVTTNGKPVTDSNPFIIRHPDADEDAFSRLRVSQNVTLFDSQFQYDDLPFLWQSSGSLGGLAVFRSDLAAVSMSVPSTAGAYVIRQTFEYFRYQPGKSQSIIMTGVMGDAPAGSIKRLGYFDNRNGLFFTSSGSVVYVGLRTSLNTPFGVGAGTDTLIPQSQWNLDKMNGAGPSGITLDITKAQIFIIDFQWLGTGRVRFGFDGHNGPVYVHELRNANVNANVYMVSPNLPLRYEIINVEGGSPSMMQQICSSVISEGGVEESRGIDRSVTNGTTVVTVTQTKHPVLSIRPRTRIMTVSGPLTQNGPGFRNRVRIIPLEASIYVSTADNIYYEVVYNGVLTGATWAQQVSSGSVEAAVEADIAASAITGGTVVDSGVLMQTTGKSIILDLRSRLPFALDLAGGNHCLYTIVAQNFVSGNASVGAIIKWKELY